ncbi:ATP-binding cassette, subfamily D (ALD), member 4 [Entomortierella parvispora]|uniref:ATP-binding cassette, subfamily D (ALD), member 4 n=1 Tax=Entomortierella parvispora TaxID=205924 RepID=A0A9P3M0K3_9FUNG|nr:ATP-binding cassette, subfamily D (ALD), member 4 [Entomortierella parvispora]
MTMYRLVPTEDEARDEDRTETGSIHSQNGYHPHPQPSTPRTRIQSFMLSLKNRLPSFLRSSIPSSTSFNSSASWGSRTTAVPRHVTNPGAGFVKPKDKREYKLDSLFFKRFIRILEVLFANRSMVFWLYISMILFCCLNEGIVYYVGLIPSRYYKVLVDKEKSAFFQLLGTSLFTVFLAGFGKSGIFLLGSLLAMEGRKTLTLYFHRIYLRPKLFYRITMMHEEDVDNPDQRITQDIDKLMESLKRMVEELIIIPLLIIFYTYQCWLLAGYTGPLFIYGYFIISAITSRILINPIVDAIFYKESAEGYFRFLHVRFRQCAESITFSRGEAEAKNSADESLEVLMVNQLNVIYKELPLQFLQQSVSYFGSILSYVIIAIPIFMGDYDHLPPSDITVVISKISFVSMYLTYQFSKIIKCGTDFSDVAGYTSRLGQLMEALDNLNTEMENIAIDFPHEESVSSDSTIRFEDVSFNTPSGELIVSDFTYTFEVGTNTMIVGSNGTGKTSILRVMGGLWPMSRGQVILPQQYRKDLIFLPQTPYLTYGTLREQLVYPHKDTAATVSDAEIIRVLKLARLEHIAEMVQDFDFTYTLDWTKMLSPGEQQKMAFARLFYARPVFAVLDEATSSMDNDSEIEMFNQCRLLNITCITVCHNVGLARFHQRQIRLNGTDGGWSTSEISGPSNVESHDDYDDGGQEEEDAPTF